MHWLKWNRIFALHVFCMRHLSIRFPPIFYVPSRCYGLQSRPFGGTGAETYEPQRFEHEIRYTRINVQTFSCYHFVAFPVQTYLFGREKCQKCDRTQGCDSNEAGWLVGWLVGCKETSSDDARSSFFVCSPDGFLFRTSLLWKIFDHMILACLQHVCLKLYWKLMRAKYFPWELTYPSPRHFCVDDFPFLQSGYA